MKNEKLTNKTLTALGLDSNTYRIIKTYADHVRIRHIPTNRIADIRY